MSNWRKHAACSKTGKSRAELDALFFPDTGVSQVEAKKICASCPVQEVCLEFAMVNHIEFGIWGGTSERKRRQLRRERWKIAE